MHNYFVTSVTIHPSICEYNHLYIRIYVYMTGVYMPHPLEDEINQLHAEICAGLADPKRILILYTLHEKPCNVNELVETLNLSQPLVSRHLKILRERGMVTTNRIGTTVAGGPSEDLL